MAKNVFLATILAFLIVSDVSDASFFFQTRKLVAPSPKISPVPSPVMTDGKKSSSVGGGENEPTPDSTKAKAKLDHGETPPADTKKEKGDIKPDLPHGVKESCNGISQKCQDTKLMTACVTSYSDVSKELVLVIQNGGDIDINVDLMIPPSLDKKKLVDVPKHETEMANIPLPNPGTNEIRLSGGNGDCIIHLGPPTPQGNFFRLLPSYSKFITPVYGAYLLFLVVLISGGVWGCCWFRKRRSKTLMSEIPYQELEMSVPETAGGVVETAEGWDQVWDDDWDEEKAVKSPGAPNISANGFTSRTPSKEDWEDWND